MALIAVQRPALYGRGRIAARRRFSALIAMLRFDDRGEVHRAIDAQLDLSTQSPGFWLLHIS
jgi:hypothetical protein